MFGSKNRLSVDEIREMKENLDESQKLFEQMEEARQIFDADVREIGEAFDRLGQDADQSSANIDSISNLAQQNVETEASLIFQLEELVKNLRALDQVHESMVQRIQNQAANTQAVVEQNKHFTTPSKEISEIPNIIRDNTGKSRSTLVKMSDCCKQMTVLSLNAAIEAGRMGEQGMQFVRVAEEIRSYSYNYNSAIAEMESLLNEQEHWSAKIEDQIHHLINLIKESNIATGKLMKQNHERVADIDRIDSPKLPERMDDIRNKVIGIRNSEEEIVKAEERNRMQMGYITEELMSSRKNIEEVVNKANPLFDKANSIRGTIKKEENINDNRRV